MTNWLTANCSTAELSKILNINIILNLILSILIKYF